MRSTPRGGNNGTCRDSALCCRRGGHTVGYRVMPRPIIVIGSINMDLVCRAPAIPRRGETVLGSDFTTVPGGKGANQAVAAARLSRGGGEVPMVGRVGDDDFGRQLLAGLRDNHVNTSHVRVTAGV